MLSAFGIVALSPKEFHLEAKNRALSTERDKVLYRRGYVTVFVPKHDYEPIIVVRDPKRLPEHSSIKLHNLRGIAEIFLLPSGTWLKLKLRFPAYWKVY